jgi:hypothetical protein
LLLFAGWLEAVTNPGLSDDVMRRTFGVYLFAELRHENSQMFGLFDTIRTPDGQEQRSMGHHPPCVPGEKHKQFEFLGS